MLFTSTTAATAAAVAEPVSSYITTTILNDKHKDIHQGTSTHNCFNAEVLDTLLLIF
jgi:hypothetical protein